MKVSTFIFLSLWLASAALCSADTTQPTGIALPVTVQSPGTGFMSLGVFDSSGKRIRALTYAKPVTAGSQNVTWDGATDLGVPAAPGSYQVRGIWFDHQPTAKYLMKIGESGTPPYPTEDGTGGWGGNLGPPLALCSNSQNVLAAFQCVESREITGVQRMDLNGKVIDRYNTFFGWDSREACVMDDTNLYMVILNGAGSPHQVVIGKYTLGNPAGKILCSLPFGDHEEVGGRWKGRWTAKVLGIALNQGRLFVPMELDDKVFAVDANTGAILGSVSIPSPRGIAAFGGSVYVLSGTSLVKLDQTGQIAATIVSSGLDDPAGLAIDGQGNFYVADGGAAQQIKVFSPAGKPIRSVGEAGGRPREGFYDPNGMLDPRGVCVASDGNVWVAEDNEDYQRISVWAPTGKLVHEFFNMRISAGQGMLSPDRSEMLQRSNFNSDAPGMTAYKINWTNDTWYPSWHLTLTEDEMHQDSFLTGDNHIFGQLFQVYNGRSPYLGFTDGMVKANNGHTYLIGGDLSIYEFDESTLKLRLASLVYMHQVVKKPDGSFSGDYDQGPGHWMTWADLNGDGKMDPSEATYHDSVPQLVGVPRPIAWEVEPDLSIMLLLPNIAHRLQTGRTDWSIWKLPTAKVLADGTPVYDWSLLTKIVSLDVPDFHGGDGYKGPTDVNMSDLKIIDNTAYIMADPRPAVKLRLTGIDGDSWWASRTWRRTPLAFDLQTGEPKWLKMGKRAPGAAQPGEMYYLDAGLSGSAEGCDFYNDVLGKDWVWSSADGLYVGSIYNGYTNPARDSNSIFVESTGSWVYTINGTVYALTGDQGVFVHQVDLPKLVPVTGGTVQLSAQETANVQPWDPDGPTPGTRPVYVAHSIFNFDKTVNAPVRKITVDGTIDPLEWSGVPAMPIALDGKHVADVRASFDRQNLYLAYQVTDPHPLQNSGTELPYSPFVSGSYVDFRVAPTWDGTSRSTPIEGDVRVILARITSGNQGNYQMGFWPVRAGGVNPQVITSPAQQKKFDDISPVNGLNWAYTVTPAGYNLEVSVPWSSLGIVPQRQPEIGFDASVAFSNPAGTERVRAAHWDGESEGLVVDRPGSAQVDPEDWGTLELDRTPLPAPPAAQATASPAI